MVWVPSLLSREGLGLLPFALPIPGMLLISISGVTGPLLAAYLPFVAVGLIITVLEETGWMGFAAPKLQARTGPVSGAMILGVLWGIWHLPGFLGAGANVDYPVTDQFVSVCGGMQT